MQRRHLLVCTAATGILTLFGVSGPIPLAASQPPNGPLIYLRNFAGDQFVVMRSAAAYEATPHGYALRLQGPLARQAINQQISRQSAPDSTHRFDASLLDPAGTWINLADCIIDDTGVMEDGTTRVDIAGSRLPILDRPLARIPSVKRQET